MKVLTYFYNISLIDFIKNYNYPNYENNNKIDDIQLNNTKYFYLKYLLALEWNKN